jgi:DNA-binding transcriptional ArsR family regulator
MSHIVAIPHFTARVVQEPIFRLLGGFLSFHYYRNMESQSAVTALSALAQENRLSVFRLLVRAGPDGVAAGEIAAELDIPNATLSFHLNQLRHADLVSFRRTGRSLIYAAKYDSMNELLAYLTENCCQGSVDCDVDACETTTASRKEGTSRNETSARARSR